MNKYEQDFAITWTEETEAFKSFLGSHGKYNGYTGWRGPRFAIVLKSGAVVSIGMIPSKHSIRDCIHSYITEPYHGGGHGDLVWRMHESSLAGKSFPNWISGDVKCIWLEQEGHAQLKATGDCAQFMYDIGTMKEEFA